MEVLEYRGAHVHIYMHTKTQPQTYLNPYMHVKVRKSYGFAVYSLVKITSAEYVMTFGQQMK